MTGREVLGDCDAFDCEFSAVRRVRWPTAEGIYCDDHADVLVRGGDQDVTFAEQLDAVGRS